MKTQFFSRVKVAALTLMFLFSLVSLFLTSTSSISSTFSLCSGCAECGWKTQRATVYSSSAASLTPRISPPRIAEMKRKWTANTVAERRMQMICKWYANQVDVCRNQVRRLDSIFYHLLLHDKIWFSLFTFAFPRRRRVQEFAIKQTTTHLHLCKLQLWQPWQFELLIFFCHFNFRMTQRANSF